MGLFDTLRTELIDIIEWIDDSRHTIAWRFPRYHNQIKNGAQLIVRPGQVAVFVHRGEIADSFDPGHYELTTDNLPILSTIMGWKYGFDSPFKAECYFISTRHITELKWGTPNPIMLRDPDFGPIRLRAFGTYSLRCSDPKALLRELIGTDQSFEADEIMELMRSIIISSLADILGKSKVAALDLAANYREFSEQLRKTTLDRVDDEYGLDVPQLDIVNISFPEEVEKALDTRSSMGVLGDMGRFQQYQMGKAMTAAAENPAPGGGASAGMGLGVGMAMANEMMRGGAMGGGAVGAAPPPPPPAMMWHVAVNGQTQGPFDPQQLVQQIRTGQVTAATNVYTPALGGWMQAGQVPQLTPYFAPAPPPPPPPE